MNRTLIIGENPQSQTLFGTMIRELAGRFVSDGVEVACMSFNFSGWPYRRSVFPYPIYPWVGSPNNPLNIEAVLDEYKPDTLLLIGPPSLFSWLKDFSRKDDYHTILHTAFKCTPINDITRAILSCADTVVVNSKHDWNIVNSEISTLNTCIIPPGLNTASLKTATNSRESDGKFRIACFAKDAPKVDFPSLFKAFGIIAQQRSDILFGVFSDASQLSMWNIPDMLEVYGLSDKCDIMPLPPDMHQGSPSKSDIYCSADLIVLPHQEHIINIPAIEASYCGIPLLTAPGGPTAEYLPDTVVFLRDSDFFISPPGNTRYAIFNAEEIASHVVSAPASRVDMFQLSVYREEVDALEWKNVSNQWIGLLED